MLATRLDGDEQRVRDVLWLKPSAAVIGLRRLARLGALSADPSIVGTTLSD